MSDPNRKEVLREHSQTAPDEVQPSWKPLIWLVTVIAAVIALGELLLDALLHGGGLLLEGFELIYLALIEAPEEIIEDKVEEWFKLDPLNAEIAVFWTLTPVKILIGFFLLRAIWRWKKRKLFPRIAAWTRSQYLAVRLAWAGLAWYWKALIVVAAVGSLFIVV